MPQPPGPPFTPTPESRPFWAATRRHELVLPSCRACGTLFYYPRAACPSCLSSDLDWQRVSGRGRLNTFTVVHRGLPNFPLGDAVRHRDRRARRGAADDDQPGRRRSRSREARDRHAGRGGLRGRVRRRSRCRCSVPPERRDEPARACAGASRSSAPPSPTRSASCRTRSALALHAEAARNALADAGLTKDDVDGVFSAGRWMAAETAEYMGIRPRYLDGTLIGGCSFIAHVQHAMARDRRRALRRRAHHPRRERRVARRHAGHALRSRRRADAVRERLRPRRPADRYALAGDPPHARLRHHQRAARGGGRRHAQVGEAEPAGDDARSDHRRRRARLAARSPGRSICSTAASSPTRAAPSW